MEFRLASAAFIAVFATYLFLGGMGVSDRGNLEPRDVAYNQLTRGLLSGHLYLDTEVPPGFAALRNPYDASANSSFRVDPRYRLHDLSYYHGRLYLYFGIAPALLLFAPWHLLTGLWLPHWAAVIILCSAGVLVNLSLVHSVKERVFPGSPAWMAAAFALMLGLGSYAPVVIARSDVWEIPIVFAYAALSIALRCLWQALCEPARKVRWIAFASAAMGVAFASRPTVLPAAAILLVPLLDGGTRRNPRNWLAAVVPVALCGAGVALYNALRFGNPLEFGTSYMLTGGSPADFPAFSASYFWTNVRLNLFQGVDWQPVFPFAHEPDKWVLRPNVGGTDHIAGVLLNCPLLWAGLAVPAFIRASRPERGFVLFSASVAWTALCAMAVLLFYCGANERYQMEFVPELAVLACLGMMALESLPPGLPRVAARCVWIPALLASVAFPVLYGIDRCVAEHNSNALVYLSRGNMLDAETEIQNARFLSPGSPVSRLTSGLMLAAVGKPLEAQRDLEALARDFPGYAMAHYCLGNVLAGERMWGGAISQYRIAHVLRPEDPVIKAALDAALARAR